MAASIPIRQSFINRRSGQETRTSVKILPCKYCKAELTANKFKTDPFLYKTNDENNYRCLAQGKDKFYGHWPMDNLTYIEKLAEEKGLI
jgi:hypothetical protein